MGWCRQGFSSEGSWMKTFKELKGKNEGYQEDQNLADLVGGEASDMIKALKKGDVRKAKTSYKAIGRLLK